MHVELRCDRFDGAALSSRPILTVKDGNVRADTHMHGNGRISRCRLAGGAPRRGSAGYSDTKADKNGQSERGVSDHARRCVENAHPNRNRSRIESQSHITYH
jgi:hypothetical protein